MLTQERKQLILDQLKKTGRVIAKDFSSKLKLSEDTIRRDLRELAAEGLLQRVHGGALPASPTLANLAQRRGMAVEEKVALAHLAAKSLQKGQSIFLDGGTSNLELVRAIPLELPFQVFTHSPTIAAALEQRDQVEVVVIGGSLFKHSMVCLGASAARAIENLRVDVFFLGLTGLHAKEGATTGHHEEAAMKALIAERAAEVVSIVSQEKIGAVSPHRIGNLAMLTAIYATRHDGLQSLRKAGLKIISL
jgi:DeoR/GlpR family transcriptional regulator of sugar metabolism